MTGVLTSPTLATTWPDVAALSYSVATHQEEAHDYHDDPTTRGPSAPWGTAVRSLALLRGVNVGGHHKVAMKDLASWLGDAGFTSVTTYIQSGNVVLDHDPDHDVASMVRAAIAEHAGFDVAVLVRSAREMATVVVSNPFPEAPPTTLHVAFRQHEPDAALLASLDPARWEPEQFVTRGREVYLHLPAGMGRSTMVPRLALVKEATIRNWNTVTVLTEMLTR